MGLISLPNVDEIAHEKDPKRQMEMMLNTLGILMKNLSELNGYINSKNVKDITADKISAGTINTGDITVGTANGGRYYRIDDAGIVANNGTVNTMLFDLMTGLMTLTSVLVQSQVGYPKVVLNSGSDLIAAYADADTFLSIQPLGTGSVPALSMVDAGTIKGFLNRSVGGTTLGTFDGENLNFQAAGNVNIAPTGNLQINGTNGATGTFYVSATNGGPTNVQVNFTKGVRTL